MWHPAPVVNAVTTLTTAPPPMHGLLVAVGMTHLVPIITCCERDRLPTHSRCCLRRNTKLPTSLHTALSTTPSHRRSNTLFTVPAQSAICSSSSLAVVSFARSSAAWTHNHRIAPHSWQRTITSNCFCFFKSERTWGFETYHRIIRIIRTVRYVPMNKRKKETWHQTSARHSSVRFCGCMVSVRACVRACVPSRPVHARCSIDRMGGFLLLSCFVLVSPSCPCVCPPILFFDLHVQNHLLGVHVFHALLELLHVLLLAGTRVPSIYSRWFNFKNEIKFKIILRTMYSLI